MGQQYNNQSRDRALQNRFTGYFQVALKRKKRDYIQKQLRKKAHEFPANFQASELADGSNFGFDEGWKGLSQLEDIALAQALSGLTARERFILFERVLNDQGYDEIAEALDLRYSGVASAYHRTTGRDPLTGKQVQRTFSGKTQREVLEKMQAVAVEVSRGTYTPPSKMTVGEWLDIWQREYLGNAKYNTVRIYTSNIKNHIKPALGAVRLDRLHPHTVQMFINRLEGLAPQTVRMIYQVLHLALEKAVDLEYIPKNPAARCVLPKKSQEEIKPLDDAQAAALLAAAKGGELEHLITVALFTGMRISELLGLTWDSVDMEAGTITVDKQLSRFEAQSENLFASPKSGRARTLTPAPSVMRALQAQYRLQLEMRIRAGQAWDNPHKLVFTNAVGRNLFTQYVNRHFRELASAAGLEGVRFHDLRHTYAVNAIRAGDDIKTIQGNLGHATAAFTLDKYGHLTDRMKQDSAARMEGFIKNVLEL